MEKRLYEFALPRRRNNAGLSYDRELYLWELFVLEQVGGYTRGQHATGVWRDHGTDYVDPMIPFRVLCSPKDRQLLLDAAFKLFDDQVAFFVSDLGTAQIIYRKDT